MRIAVMGTGGVGGYFGGRLAAAGNDVAFVARGDHLAAIRAGGLTVRSGLGDFQVPAARATDDPAEIGPVDVVMFTPKLYDVESAGEACRPLVGPATMLVTFQNGIDAPERLGAVLGAAHVVPGIAYIPAEIAEPGVIQQRGKQAAIAFGETDGRSSDRVQRFHAACSAAGIDAHLRDNIVQQLWHKFVMLASFAALTCMTRRTAGVLREDPDLRQVLTEAIDEAAAVGRARGIDLGADTTARALGFLDAMPSTAQASMLTDLQRGKRLELAWLSGAVVRLGGELGVPTPIHRIAYAVLKPYANGTPAG